MRALGLSFLLLLGAFGIGHGQDAKHSPVAFIGSDSKIKSKFVARADDAKAWRGLWLKHMGYTEKTKGEWLNREGVPEVDFTRSTVLAIFIGATGNSAGVELISSEEDGDLLRVRVRERWFQTGGGVHAQPMDTTPYGIFVLPKTAKKIIVEENMQSRTDQPPVWRVIARL